MGMSTFLSGQISSCLRKRGVLTTTVLRKTFTGIGELFGEGTLLLKLFNVEDNVLENHLFFV